MRRRALLSACGSLLTTSMLLAASAAPVRATQVPVHVTDAETLVQNIDVSRQNVYGSSPSYITWNGTNSQARTVCGTFITNLLLHSYNWTPSTFTQWMGTTSPYAETYHAAILAQNNFTQIENIEQVQPGDIIAVKYFNSSVTGHAMLVDSYARAHAPTAPIVPGTTQYTLTVIDSSSLHHGATDTRVSYPSPSGNGIGKGDLRVYVDSSFTPVGYTWADEPGSQYYSMAQRPMAIGRINLTHLGVVPPPGKNGASSSNNGGSGPPMGNGGDTGTSTGSPPAADETAGKTDDDTLAVSNMNAAQVGGCSSAGHSQGGMASPAALMAIALLLGLVGQRRRHSTAIA